MHVALVGNLTEGFTAYGPFKDFDEAAQWAEGRESWVMELKDPLEEKQREKAIEELEQYAKKLGVTEEDLDDAVHNSKGEEAAGIDNAGRTEQLAYLLDGFSGDLPRRVAAIKVLLEGMKR